LRNFRDKYLLTNSFGRAFVNFYYENSPSLAKYIAASETRRAISRIALTPLVYGVKFPIGVLIIMLLFVAVMVIRRRKKWPLKNR